MDGMLNKGLALLILAVFYGCYLIKMLLQHHKGIRTNQIGKGKNGKAKIIENLMKLATYLAPLAELVTIFLQKAMPPVPLQFAGLVIAALGDAIFILSVSTMKDSWRAGVSETDHTKLVTEGIYRFSRNPAFLAFDLVYAGILCCFFNWYLLAASVYAAAMFHLQITCVEEDFLSRRFGDEYAEYRNHVHRYLGRKR